MTRALAVFVVLVLVTAAFLIWRLGTAFEHRFDPAEAPVERAEPAAIAHPSFPYTRGRSHPLITATRIADGEEILLLRVSAAPGVVRKREPRGADLHYEAFTPERAALHRLLDLLLARPVGAGDEDLRVHLIEEDGRTRPVAIDADTLWREVEALRGSAGLRPARPRAVLLRAVAATPAGEDRDLVWPLRRPTIEQLLERPERIEEPAGIDRAVAALVDGAVWRDADGPSARVRALARFDVED